MQRLAESSVGAFYMIGNNIIANATNVARGESYGDFVNYSNHWDLWKVVCRAYPLFRRFEYDDFPRGRVVFNKKDRQFIIYLDKKLNNKTHIDKICKEFGLGTNYVVNDTDEHYVSRMKSGPKLNEDMIIRESLFKYVDMDIPDGSC